MADRSTQVGVGVARAGLAGNPSDALGGAALAVPISALRAEVRLTDAERVSVTGPFRERSWASMEDLDTGVVRVGHEGGDRLVTAALVTLWRWARGRGSVADRPFEAVWSTAIPRSVGLAGSSALIVATMRAAADRWDVEIEPPVLAGLALATERDELGLAAGWMDRAVQAHDAPTLVDIRTTGEVDGMALPAMRVVVAAPIDLVVAWDPLGAAPSGRLHRGLRARFDAGEPGMEAAVTSLIEQAEAAAEALSSGDRPALHRAVSASCELRRDLGALDGRTSALVDLARRAGAAATSAGSGGAVSVVPAEGGLEAALDSFAVAGVPTVTVSLG